jgi:hypothetical protein
MVDQIGRLAGAQRCANRGVVENARGGVSSKLLLDVVSKALASASCSPSSLVVGLRPTEDVSHNVHWGATPHFVSAPGD